MKFYLALDGTTDITEEKRARTGAQLGPRVMVCTLPENQDPDDLTAEQWREIEAAAEQALPVYLRWMRALEAGEKKKSAMRDLARYLRQWSEARPDEAPAYRKAVCTALEMTAKEYTAWSEVEEAGEVEELKATGWFPPDWDAMPPQGATGAEKAYAGRPEIRNWYPVLSKKWVNRVNPVTKKTEWQEVDWTYHHALPVQVVVERISDLTERRLRRMRSPGAREPLLFFAQERSAGEISRHAATDTAQDFPRLDDEGEPLEDAPSFTGGAHEAKVVWLQTGAQFRTFGHRTGKLQFDPKQDPEGTVYCTHVDAFHAAAETSALPEYESVASRPHWPPIAGHFYTWRTPKGYKATGERFGELLRFFTNYKEPRDLALIAAALCTPGWGGSADKPYGCRPMIVIEADDRGAGKTTLAHVIGDLWGGWLSYTLSKSSADEFLQRVLSPGGLLRRVVLVDNVKSVLADAHLEAWITEERFSGKRMYQGEATRPNDFTWLATLNSARLSRDIAERSFIVRLEQPSDDVRGIWSRMLAEFMARHAPEVVADIIALLKAPLPDSAAGVTDRRAPLWAEQVLARVCASEAFLAALPEGEAVTAGDVVAANQAERDARDQDRETAEDIGAYVLDRCCDRYTDSGTEVEELPAFSTFDYGRVPEKIFVPTNHKGARKAGMPMWGMRQWVIDATGWDKGMSAQRCRQLIEGFHASKHLPFVWYHRSAHLRGYYVSGSVVVEELKRRESEDKKKRAQQ